MDDVVGDASRCVLAWDGEDGPSLLPLAFWSDGTALWMSMVATSTAVSALLRRPGCAVYVPPAQGERRGTVLRGRARVFGLNDPVGLALHVPTVSAAMAALAIRSAPAVGRSVNDLARLPRRLAPRNRVAVKVDVVRLRAVEPPAPAGGMAPALPGVVPPGVRRALAGQRHAVLVVRRDGGSGDMLLAPVTWDDGFRLTGPPGLDLPADAVPAAAWIAAEPSAPPRRPSADVGLVLQGQVTGARLRATRATWWHGGDRDSADVAAVGGIVLPD